ncbi:Protein of unknown function DUF262 [Bradyrhizobium brasilense]|uniref:GmrSD restriction endonucleases N-terminal domain-containing protein n=1 Tax=Bradyrhizobium brasilense TaxID=1419277 RepID=A0A1G6RV94_9BRAD|nr:DUF262 domain-containing protein [Bradyrhizobium brasilense]SDD08371.1 Protein of unknown function DUF262 [Bradyrhizobium brasilense]
MIVRQRQWKITRLLTKKNAINLNPIWQRGPAWQSQRQVLLIDSVLRGMDLPKIYLRKLTPSNAHTYDAVDGQQRLRAIWQFVEGEIRLDYFEPLAPIDGHPVAGHTYNTLHKTLRKRFDEFQVCVAEIEKSTMDEITTLFSRLQMGVSLNPAELRNAMLGPMRHVIDTIATSHEFFEECRIPATRYKRQDYVTHAFAMAAYDGRRDIKAPDLKAMVQEYGPQRMNEVLSLSAEVGECLNVLAQVNRLADFRITQKWIFVDLFYLILRRYRAGAAVDPAKLFAAYEEFEALRREYTSRPEALVSGKKGSTLDRHLYDYITAFKAQGAVAVNLRARADALTAFCPRIDARS